MIQEVRILFNLVSRDLQSTTGRNLKYLAAQSGTDPWIVGPGELKAALHQNQKVDVPPQDRWRVEYLKSLLRRLVEVKSMQENDGGLTQLLIDSLVR